MSTSNQQTLVDSGANERPTMLEIGNYIPCHVRHSRLMDEFDKFATKEGESLESVYERLTTLVNIMDQNNVFPIPVSINTKFLNCLQPEWSKYVTMVSSKAKKVAKNHDPLALLVHSNASSSQSHANSSYSPSFITQAITQKFSTPTNNRLRTSSNTRNQAVFQDGKVNIQTKNTGYGRNGNRNAGRHNKNQAFNAGNGNDDGNQIVHRVSQTESTQGKANV
ncbi:hypothetical protein Tco_1503399 [Tanacetum coccineum]